MSNPPMQVANGLILTTLKKLAEPSPAGFFLSTAPHLIVQHSSNIR